jgi:perosamine synthetase
VDELTRRLSEAISQGGSGNAEVVGDLEAAFAKLMGAQFAICTSSGTAALICALRAAGVRPGDVVAVSALGPAMTGLAIAAVGARPVFCDTASPSSFGISHQSAEQALSQHPKAAVLVPMWGYWDEQPATLDAFGRAGVPVIVDAAQAPFLQLRDDLFQAADLVCLSLHGRKPFKAGEGGVCLTARRHLADRVVQLRNFGQAAHWDGRHITPTGPFGARFGVNLKMNALGAAWCLTQVQDAGRLREHFAALRAIAAEMLAEAQVPWEEASQSPAVTEHGRYGIVAVCAGDQDARRLAGALLDRDIEVDSSRYQYQPMYHAGHMVRYAAGICPNAEQLTRHAVACRLEAFAACQQRTETPERSHP